MSVFSYAPDVSAARLREHDAEASSLPSGQLRVLELEPVRAKRTRTSNKTAPSRRLRAEGRPIKPIETSPLPRLAPLQHVRRVQNPPAAARPAFQPPRTSAEMSATSMSNAATATRLPPLQGGALVSQSAAPDAFSRRAAAAGPGGAPGAGGDFLPSPWSVQRPHRRRSSKQAAAPVRTEVRAWEPPSTGGARGAGAPERARAEVAAAGPGSLDAEAAAPAPAPISVQLDALRSWSSAEGSAADFAEDARAQLGVEITERPLAQLAQSASLVLRAGDLGRDGKKDALSRAERVVVSALRFMVDLRALAFATGVAQSKLWAELLSWHEKRGQASGPASPALGAGRGARVRGFASLPDSPVPVAGRGARVRARPSAAEGGGFADARRRGAAADAAEERDEAGASGGVRERPMQRTQHGTRADTLVAVAGGVSSTESAAVRRRLAELARAADSLRMAIRVKIEDEQDLMLAWRVRRAASRARARARHPLAARARARALCRSRAHAARPRLSPPPPGPAAQRARLPAHLVRPAAPQTLLECATFFHRLNEDAAASGASPAQRMQQIHAELEQQASAAVAPASTRQPAAMTVGRRKGSEISGSQQLGV